MDQRIKDYARQRREDPAGPGPLHPATRRMLQQQARESYPPGSVAVTRSNPPSFWPAWLREPLWVGLLTVATLMMIGVVLLSRPGSSPKEGQYAKANISEASGPAVGHATATLERVPADYKKSMALDAMKAETSPSRAAERVASVSDAPSRRSASSRDEASRPQAAPAPLSPVPASMPLAKELEKDKASAAPAATVRTLASTAAPQASAAPLSALADNGGWNMSFEQASGSSTGVVAPDLLGRSKLGLKRPEKQKQSPLLQSFNMNYRDGTVLFQESDGSTYQGSLTPVTVEEFLAQQPRKTPQTAFQSRAFAGVQGNAMNSQSVVAGLYRFQAQGSNQSLRQWVFLQGQLSNTLTAVAQRDQGGTDLTSSKAAGQGWEIQSSVRVGSQTPINLNARQVPANSGSQSPSQKP